MDLDNSGRYLKDLKLAKRRGTRLVSTEEDHRHVTGGEIGNIVWAV